MQTSRVWIWQQSDWPQFRWDQGALALGFRVRGWLRVKGYYDALERTQRGSVDVTDWLAWFLAQVEASATAAEKTVDTTLAKARFWLRHQAADLNERQRKVLNRLLDAGRDGFEGGINTRRYMSLTKTSRATAYRELALLVEKGCLTPTRKGGRSSGYEIVW